MRSRSLRQRSSLRTCAASAGEGLRRPNIRQRRWLVSAYQAPQWSGVNVIARSVSVAGRLDTIIVFYCQYGYRNYLIAARESPCYEASEGEGDERSSGRQKSAGDAFKGRSGAARRRKR